MLSKADIKKLEKKYSFVPQKRLGQNFLIDSNVKTKLIESATVDRDDILLEIGSGLGQLTFELAEAAKRVIAVEYDKKLFSILSDLAKDFSNIVLAHNDFLKFNLRDFIPRNKKIRIVSNLPFYISSPVILKLLAHNAFIDTALLTLQQEAADRLIARPGTKEYGSMTIFAEFHAEVKRLFSISKNCFYPSPQVDSTVILIKMRAEPPVDVSDKEDLFDLVRAAFSQRRKTLYNAVLSQRFKGMNKEDLKHILHDTGISANARAEALTLSDFARIANSI